MEEHKKPVFSRWAEGLIVLQSLVYGLGDPISKIAFEVTPVYALMTVRYSIAFVITFVLFRKRIIDTLKTVPVRAWLIPCMCISLCYIVNNVALLLTDATSVAFLRSLSVVMTPAFAFILYRKKYKWQHILAQVLVLPGMYLLCVKGGLSGFGAGEVLALCSAAFSAGAIVFSKKYLEMIDPMSMTSLMAGCSALLAFAGCIFVEGGIHLETATPQAWLIILYLAVACTFLGFLMQNIALTRISERSVSLLQSLNPVMTAVFAFIILGEVLSPSGIAGAGIITLCVVTATLF